MYKKLVLFTQKSRSIISNSTYGCGDLFNRHFVFDPHPNTTIFDTNTLEISHKFIHV